MTGVFICCFIVALLLLRHDAWCMMTYLDYLSLWRSPLLIIIKLRASLKYLLCTPMSTTVLPKAICLLRRDFRRTMLRAARRKEKRRSFNLSSRQPSRERRRLHAGDWYKRRIYIASLSVCPQRRLYVLSGWSTLPWVQGLRSTKGLQHPTTSRNEYWWILVRLL